MKNVDALVRAVKAYELLKANGFEIADLAPLASLETQKETREPELAPEQNRLEPQTECLDYNRDKDVLDRIYKDLERIESYANAHTVMQAIMISYYRQTKQALSFSELNDIMNSAPKYGRSFKFDRNYIRYCLSAKSTGRWKRVSRGRYVPVIL